MPDDLTYPCPFCIDGVRGEDPCESCGGSGKRQVVPRQVVTAGYRCDDCWDTGWTTRLGEGAGVATRCHCQDPGRNPEALRDRLLLAGVGDTEIDSVFEEWKTEARVPRETSAGGDVMAETVSIPRPVFALDWFEWMLTARERGTPRPACPASCAEEMGEPRTRWLLTLMGPPGGGKSMTAAKLLAKWIKRNGSRPVWARVPTAVKAIMAERRADGFSVTEARLIAAGLLVLDDLGYRVDRDPDGSHAETIANIGDERQRFKRPTICTTNAAVLADFGNPRLESRLAGGVYRVVGGGVDFRDLRR